MNKSSIKKFFLAAAVAVSVSVGSTASAATIQLGFILDRSGSIGAANWSIIVNGLATAIANEIPVGGPDTYEVSVVTFATSATTDVANFLVTDAAARTALAAQIGTLDDGPFLGGGTNFAPAFNAMLNALNNTTIGTSYVNFATDGVEGDAAAAVVARNALIAAGVDNISIEGIGAGVDAVGLQTQYCYPGPCDNTVPFDFPTFGFYLGVANATAYADAIGNKIAVVTGGAIPEPATLALLGLGLAGVAVARRRKKA